MIERREIPIKFMLETNVYLKEIVEIREKSSLLSIKLDLLEGLSAINKNNIVFYGIYYVNCYIKNTNQGFIYIVIFYS